MSRSLTYTLLASCILASFQGCQENSEQQASSIEPPVSNSNQSLISDAENADTQTQFLFDNEYAIGQTDTESQSEAYMRYRKAAEEGQVEAQIKLGLYYRDGIGVERDYDQSIKWYSLAAETGNPIAQLELATLYLHYKINPNAGPKEYDVEIEKWLRKAAEQGNAVAQAELGGLYLGGRGVPKNFEKGYQWLSLSAGRNEGISTEMVKYLEDHVLSEEQIIAGKTLALTCYELGYRNCD